MEQDLSLLYTVSADTALETVQSSTEGLSQEEAEARLKQYGENALPKPRRTGALKILFNQLKSFLIVILVVAAGISYALHEATDALIILAAVGINVVVGFIQENKAERALEALRSVITLQATVIRDGKDQVIPVEQLVPGDVIALHAGDKVPADARLIRVTELETNEAPLTGESLSIVKSLEPCDPSSGVGDRTNMVFTGTTVTQGKGRAVVATTGVQTEIGKIAALLHGTKEEATPLQKKLDRFARGIGMIVILVSMLILAIGLLQGLPFVQIFITAVAVAVSAIPEGLVVSVTIILAIGMQRILQRNALVRNLQAAETLGSTSVICTDKTGTLTQGNMQVVSLVTYDYHFDNLHTNETDRHKENGLQELLFAIHIGMLCNDAHVVEGTSDLQETQVVGNFTDRALFSAGLNIGVNVGELEDEEPRISTIPFDSKKKYMATFHTHPDGHKRLYVKGAPERVLNMASEIRSGEGTEPMTDAIRERFEQQFIEYSKRGLRILALAYADLPQEQERVDESNVTDLTFVGFVGIQDPLRPHIHDTFAVTKAAGIHTVMITGDHKITAKAIAEELGFEVGPDNILTGEELHNMTQDELNERVQEIVVYARVSPEDKLNIVRAWQSHGKVVAMTGDGVNDSPALKAADIGVALGSGTDVAKETADIVLLDDNFTTIVAAVEEGRGIFDNIRKVVLYLLSDAFSEVLLVVIALVLGLPLPLTAAQILWINLVADGLPNVALTVDPRDPEIMGDPPRNLHEPVMNGEMNVIVTVISLVTGITNIILFWYIYKSTNDVVLARSVVFATLAVDSLLYVFSVRTLRHSVFHKGFFANRWLVAAVAAAFLIQLCAFYFPPLQRVLETVPLGFNEWALVFTTSIIVIMLIEAIKYIYIVRHRVAKHDV